MSSGSDPIASSSHGSIGTFPIVAGIIGGVAACGAIALTIYLFVHARRRRMQNEDVSSPATDIEYDVEKMQSLSTPPPAHYAQRWDISPPFPQPKYQRPMIRVDIVSTTSSTKGAMPSMSGPMSQIPNRPTITVVTDIPSVNVTKPPSAQMATPKTPRTPKWKLKRVPVPRFSRLPPTPDAITRTRSWLVSPRQFRRSFDRKRTTKGLPQSVRPPMPDATSASFAVAPSPAR